MDEIRVFHHDDRAYEERVERHRGYVVTHRSAHLGRDGDLTLKLTKKAKRWAAKRHTLVDWTTEQTGQPPLICQRCL